MRPSLAAAVRSCPRVSRAAGTLAVCLAAGIAAPALAQDRAWNTGSGVWSTITNWTPLGPPPSTASALIGALAGAANGTVQLDGSRTIAGLSIANGMTVRNNHWSMHVNGPTTISGSNTVPIGGVPTLVPSRLVLDGVDGSSFIGENVTVSNGGRLELVPTTYANLTGVLSIGTGSRMSGDGTVNIDGGGTVLTNNGTIRPGAAHGLEFYRAFGSPEGAVDLDGTSGDGHLQLDMQGSSMYIIGFPLSDPFSGLITLAPDSDLFIQPNEPWAIDANGSIEVHGAGPGLDPALIGGGTLMFGGSLDVGGLNGSLRILQNTTIEPSAAITIGHNGHLEFRDEFGGFRATVNGGTFDLATNAVLEFGALARINGGSFVLGNNATIFFRGATEINGGTVQTGSNPGVVHLDGPTEWSGTFTVSGPAPGTGILIVDGPATVEAATVINARTLNMDGTYGTNTWDVTASLVINAEAIDNTTVNGFDGTLNITGGFAGQVTVNLADPMADWALGGDLNLTGDLTLYPTRVAGSKVNFLGTLNLASGRAQITADASFGAGSEITIGAATAILRMRGETTVLAGAAFPGAGTLRNGVDGVMTLEDGATLDQTGLINDAMLRIGAGSGAASVDRFQNSASGTFKVSIGGHLPGPEHDLLIVAAGDTTLAGTIQVELIDTGSGMFRPAIGNEFTILTSLDTISGTFANSPVTVAAAGTYGWTVVYTPNTVVLRLNSFVPAPCYANCDGSSVAPILNVNDFVCFQTKFAGGSPYANCDGSTASPVLNVNDFTCFLNRYAAGCP